MNNDEDAKILKLIIDNTNITQSELARRVDTTKQYIGLIVNGKRKLGYKTRNKLVQLFPSYFNQNQNIEIPNIIDNPFLRLCRTHFKLSQEEMAEKLGMSKSLYQKLEQCTILMNKEHQRVVREFCEKMNNGNNFETTTDNVEIKYLPEVKLSAGYGTEVYDEHTETVTIARKLLITERGLAINPKYCKIVTVSGDSMLPDYRDGDRVIIDESINTFIDGHVFAFGYEGQCYIKLINVLPDKIKCIPLNDKYDTFYLSSSDNYRVFGMILPRIRL